MFNLTEISISVRKMIIIFIILFILYLIFRFLFGIAINFWKRSQPVILPPPNVKWGILPKPGFTHSASSSSGLKFVLENIEGQPPEATSVGKVYSMPKKMLTLLSSERTKALAKKLGFYGEPESVDSVHYLFTTLNPKKTLLVDVVNLNFLLESDYVSNSEKIFKDVGFESESQTLNTMNNYLRGNGLFDSTLFNYAPSIQYLYFDNTSKIFNHVAKINSANAIRVDYYRDMIDHMRVVSPNFYSTDNYALYTSSQIADFLEVSYNFWPIDFGDYGTYPLISSQNAWQDLTDGYAYIISMGENTPEKIIIRKIYLAYFDNKDPQAYLQPIFVFEGDNGFVAYSLAILPAWLD